MTLLSRFPGRESERTAFRRYFVGVALGFSFIFTISLLLWRSGVFSQDYGRVKGGEISLTGPWRVSFQDLAEFSNPDFKDSEWCLLGVPDPMLTPPAQDQPSLCKEFKYHPAAFQKRIVWYRKEFALQKADAYADPSLFLGAVKERAWVYFNGSFVGITNFNDAPSILLIDRKLLRQGRNVVSLRVQTSKSEYPGLIHLYERGMALGEYQNAVRARSQLIGKQYIEPTVSLVIEFMCLLVCTFMSLYGYGLSRAYVWQTVHFGFAALNVLSICLALSPQSSQPVRFFLHTMSMVGMFLSSIGYGLELASLSVNSRRVASRVLLSGLLGYSALSAMSIFMGWVPEKARFVMHQMFLVMALSGSAALFIRYVSQSKRIQTAQVLIFSCMMLMPSYGIFLLYFASHDFPFFDFPVAVSSLSLVAILISAREYVRTEQSLSFFGRFVRPGLRELLISFGTRNLSQRKVFRGRKIPIAKIDIVGHTDLTYGMPYGIKRLFQDLWFSHIDAKFDEISFVDKNVGDGSIYCIRENAVPGPCSAALRKVLEIHEAVLPCFWKEFKSECENLLQSFPEIRPHFEDFLARFEARTRQVFWSRELKIYVALVYGYVDEGLWGQLSQSHYDVQGDLVTLAARVESAATPGEIAMDEGFAKELAREGNFQLTFDWEEKSLKGVGNVLLARITPSAIKKTAKKIAKKIA